MLLNVFRVTCVVVVFLGAQADFGLMWNIADITMGLMAIVNIVTIFLLGKIAVKALKNYEEQRKSKKEITFKGEDIGVKDTVWK